MMLSRVPTFLGPRFSSMSTNILQCCPVNSIDSYGHYEVCQILGRIKTPDQWANHRIIDDRIYIKEYKGKTNWTLRVCRKYISGAKIVSVFSWGAGTAMAHPLTTPFPMPIRGWKWVWSEGAAILLWEKVDVGFILFYSVISNSVEPTHLQNTQPHPHNEASHLIIG